MPSTWLAAAASSNSGSWNTGVVVGAACWTVGGVDAASEGACGGADSAVSSWALEVVESWKWQKSCMSVLLIQFWLYSWCQAHANVLGST